MTVGEVLYRHSRKGLVSDTGIGYCASGLSMDDFRKRWGLSDKRTVYCGVCGAEHKGRCRFLKARKSDPEDALRWMAEKRERLRLLKVRELIRELCHGVEEGKRSARWTNRASRAAAIKSGAVVGSDTRKAKRNTLTRKRVGAD